MRPAYELARHLIREAAIEAAGDRESFSCMPLKNVVGSIASSNAPGAK